MIIIKDLTLDWAVLKEPDTKYSPNWRVDATLDSTKARAVFDHIKPELLKVLRDKLENAKNEQEKDLIHAMIDDEKVLGRAVFTKTQEGNLRLRAKRAAPAGSIPPQLAGTDGKALPQNMLISGGDTVNIAVEPSVWIMAGKTAGITLNLQGVQLVNKGKRVNMPKVSGPIDWGVDKPKTTNSLGF